MFSGRENIFGARRRDIYRATSLPILLLFFLFSFFLLRSLINRCTRMQFVWRNFLFFQLIVLYYICVQSLLFFTLMMRMMLSHAYAYGLNTLKRFFSIEGIGSIISKMKSSHGWFCLRWCEWYHDSGCGLKSDSNKVESFSWSRDRKSRFVILFSSPIFRIHFRNLFGRRIEPSRGLLFYFRLRFFKYIFWKLFLDQKIDFYAHLENEGLLFYFCLWLSKKGKKMTRRRWKLFPDWRIHSIVRVLK